MAKRSMRARDALWLLGLAFGGGLLAQVSAGGGAAVWLCAVLGYAWLNRDHGPKHLWAALLGLVAALVLLYYAAGVVLFLVALLIVAFVYTVSRALANLLPSDRARFGRLGSRCLLSLGTTLVALLMLECGLLLLDRVRRPPPPGEKGNRALPVPAEWRHRVVRVEGAEHAFYWHGILHVNDIHQMRRTTPLPPRRDGVCRILAFGDSYTYGEGVELDAAYPAVLGDMLDDDYHVEILNMGVRGMSTQQIRKLMEYYVTPLEADLVLYGVCLNDLNAKPESLREVRGTHRDPVSAAWSIFVARTKSGAFLNRTGNGTLRRLGLRPDFYGEVMEDLLDKRDFFATECRLMAGATGAQGIPPPIALVLENRPRTEGPPAILAAAIEEELRAGGCLVIPSADYFADHAGKEMIVSAWEEHPNPKAHAIFATQFATFLRRSGFLDRFRKPSGPAVQGPPPPPER